MWLLFLRPAFEESIDLPLPGEPEKITKEPIFIRDPFK